MIRSFVCLKCRGPQIESPALEETCPTCGSILYGKPWDIQELARSNPGLRFQKSQYEVFVSIGSLLSPEPMLLSYATSQAYLERAIRQPNVVALVVKEEDARGIDTPISFIFSECPRADFFLLHNHLVQNTDFYGRPTPTSVAPTAQVHPSAFVATTNVVVGDQAVVGPNVTILENTKVGARTEVSAGAVLGVEGARLIERPDGSRFRALHGGGIAIGRDVFIGANAAIVRSVWRRPTTLGDGVFVGNLVNVGHNCQVSAGATILPSAVLCGRAQVGPGATVAPGAVVSGGVCVGSGAWVTLGAVVTQDVAPGTQVSGNFAIPHDKQIAHIKKIAQ